jgi:sugar lactone lactonase YvrE
MRVRRISFISLFCLFCLLITTSCAQNLSTTHFTSSPTPKRSGIPLTPAATPGGKVTPTTTLTPKGNATPDTTPLHYKIRQLLAGKYRPDDLVFDSTGRLIFSDVHRGTIDRLNANGSVTVLLSGLAAPEGLVFLPNGTLIISEQLTNRILAFSPATSALMVLRVLPGRPGKAPCKDGVDGIALDPTTQTLIVPDSPTGAVYRMSLDGQKLTLLAAHIPRPVGAAVDASGTIYVTDECGGALWKITPAGQVTRIGGFGMLDDVAFDRHGNLLLTDLKPSIHALIRLRLATGEREVLASRGFIEPQGLAVDALDNIYLSDDYADKIVEYIPM